jgi:anti-anti-sigma regulatory factor
MNPEARVYVAAGQSDHAVAIKPVGACSARVCGALAPLIQKLAAPETECIYFDLSEGTSVDSTFIGTLLKLATRRDVTSPAVHLVAPADPITESLQRMRVLEIFSQDAALPASISTWTELPAEPVDPERLADLVIEAHERLCQTDPENAAQFGKVVKLFRSQRDA